MDDFPAEPRRFWIALGLLLVTFAIAVVMSVFLTVKAHAQDGTLCAPADVLFHQFASVVKEHIIWEGTMTTPQGVLEFVLFQGETGNWTLFTVQPDGRACLAAKGEAGTPNEMGKGT